MRFRALFVPRDSKFCYLKLVDAVPGPLGYSAPDFLMMTLADGTQVKYHHAGIRSHGVIYRECV